MPQRTADARSAAEAAGIGLSGADVPGLDPHESILAHTHPAATGAASAPPGAKVCCVCGRNVSGRIRFKDKQGRYWCSDCNAGDKLPVPPAIKNHEATSACGDCGKVMPPTELSDYHGMKLCDVCRGKHQWRAKRAEERMASVARGEAIKQSRKRQVMVALGVAAILLACWAFWHFTH